MLSNLSKQKFKLNQICLQRIAYFSVQTRKCYSFQSYVKNSLVEFARLPKGGTAEDKENGVSLEFDLEIFDNDVYQQVTKPNMIPMIQEKQLIVKEIQVPFLAYQVDRCRNMNHFLAHFQNSLETLSLIENETDAKSRVEQIDFTQDFIPKQIKFKSWSYKSFQQYEFKGQLKADNVHILALWRVFPYIRVFQPKKKIEIELCH
ncbi:hypothetical protein FGO68_gene2881 [Halteria grandinella]|uniref:Uncharacterized protein n=1 Tax=Halteria grandinella TaxID=5974 RepID=A0A8J8T4C2_HALGN|nr:hypothetical protein FGO68_gene2881 [Halteria grandinella]